MTRISQLCTVIVLLLTLSGLACAAISSPFGFYSCFSYADISVSSGDHVWHRARSTSGTESMDYIYASTRLYHNGTQVDSANISRQRATAVAAASTYYTDDTSGEWEAYSWAEMYVWVGPGNDYCTDQDSVTP